MRVGYLQFDCKFGRKAENFATVKKMIDEKKADLWVFPELFNSGYCFTSKEEAKLMAEPIPDGDTSRFLLTLSKIHHCTIVAGLPEFFEKSLYNSAICVSDGNYMTKYRKCHLFDREKLWFDAGDNIGDIIRIGNINLGIMICFDWFFPEVARSLALKGIDILCHPSNLVLPYCQAAMITRCLENRIYTITANRIGQEQRDGVHLQFTGMSQVVSPKGELLHRGLENHEEAFVVTIDPLAARDKMITSRNNLFDDRRPQLYTTEAQ